MIRPRVMLLLIAAALLVVPRAAWASVVVSAELSERRVFVGQSLALDIVVEGADQSERPNLEGLDGFEVQFVGSQDESSTSVQIINGVRRDFSRKAFRHRFQLTPVRSGELVVPAIKVRVGTADYQTTPTQVRVVPPQEDPEVRLWLSCDNPSPYVGEPIRLRVTLGLRRNGVRLGFSVPGIQGKFDLIDPDERPARMQEAFSLLGVDVPIQRGSRREGDVEYSTFTVERVIVPRQGGALVLGPATVDAEIEVRPAESIFDRRQTRRVVVPSQSLTIDAKALPDQGKPSNFNGLVGRYAIEVSASPLEVGVGDPIAMEISITGPMVSAVPEPDLERQGSLQGAFRITQEAQPPETRGQTRVFKKTLRALREDVEAIPPIELPYFDTKSGRYVVAASQPIKIQVRPTRVVTASDAQGQSAGAMVGQAVEDSAGGIAFNYEGPGLLVDQGFDVGQALRGPVTLAIAGGAPAAYAAVAALALWRRRRAHQSPAKRRKQAIADARADLASISPGAPAIDAAAAVSAAMRRVLGARLDRPGQGLTARDAADALQSAADKTLAPRTQALLERCDAAVYGGLASGEARRLRNEAEDLISTIEALNGGAA